MIAHMPSSHKTNPSMLCFGGFAAARVRKQRTCAVRAVGLKSFSSTPLVPLSLEGVPACGAGIGTR